jgi:PAS domain S-box-containing protein
MQDEDKTKEQLMHELAELRQRVIELSALETGRKQAEMEQEYLLAVEREQRALNEALFWAGAVLSSTLNYDKVLDQIMEQIGRVVSHDAACIILVNGNTAQIFRQRGYARYPIHDAILPTSFDIGDIPTLQTIRETGWPLATPHVTDHNEWRTLFGQTWVRSALDIPIRTRSRLLGFLHIDREVAGFYSQSDAERLQVFANQAAIALENARRYDRARQEIARRVMALKTERNFVSAILDTANALVIVLDLEGRIIRFNRACECLTGYLFDEVDGKRLWDLFLLPAEIEAVQTIIAQLQNGEYKIEHENHWGTKQGQQRLIAWSSTALLNAKGLVQYIVSTGIDITEQRRAEDALRNSEERLKILFEYAPDAYYLNDMKGNLVDGNKAAEELIGYKKQELIGKNFLELDLLSPEHLSKAAASLNHAKFGQPTGPAEFILKRKDGGYVTVEIRTFPAKIQERTLVLGIARDITERKRAEAEREKLIEELNAFAHTVAHDLQTLLARIIGYADLLSHDYQGVSPEKLQEYAQLIAHNGRKMSDIIDELLLLSGVRQREVVLQPLDMGRIVGEALHRLADFVDKYETKVILPESWLVALGYGPWIEEVWVNYISNGIKYGGRPPRLEFGSTRLPDNMVQFWIRDDGDGLTQVEQAQLFRPFTQLHHPLYQGYGLGLSIVQRIIEKLGGQVGVESEGLAGKGSIFSFTLPEAIDNE